MKGYTDYFDGWINCKDDNYKNLRDMFIAADEGFGQRMEIEQKQKENPSKLLIQKYFDENLAKIDANWKEVYCGGELRKMACLTKGNILLRKGQYRGERFLTSQEYYQQACIILEQCYVPDQKEFLDLMIQLNLGKYFRNMGKHNQRSDYRRALDEFEDIIKKISKYPLPGSWEEHIRLEAMVNIGRTHRHLYQLKEAKKTLLDMIAEITVHSGEEIKINDRLDPYIKAEKERRGKAEKTYWSKQGKKIQIDKNDNEKKDQSGKEDSLYEYYLIQALVQLSIVFQKSREYKTGFDICVAILNRDSKNVDAANNLAVCLRKLDKKISARKYISESQNKEEEEQKKEEKKGEEQEEQQENADIDQNDPQYLDMCYQQIFDELGGKNNRFAKLHSIKCAMDELDINSDKDKTDKVKGDIEKLLKSNPNDQEVLLLEGLYWQKMEDFKTSNEILKRLYERSHQLAKGTIGLKAYYNLADNLLRQNKHHEAKKYYERIVEEFQKVDSAVDKFYSETLEKWKDVLEVPPETDLLAEIARGWCLMSLGDYESAEKCYKDLLESYKDMPERIRTENQMRIKNNLAECLLYLAACPEKNTDEAMAEKRLEEAHTYLTEVCIKEPNNATTNRHLGYYHILKAQKNAESQEKELEEALDHFKRAELYNMEDVYVHAGWVSAATQQLSRESRYEKHYGKHIENRIKYSSGVYSIKACAKLAEYIIQLEGLYQNSKKNNNMRNKYENILKTMYRSLARIRLSEKEEGYGMFRRFKENEIFRRLKADKRGELLVGLFRLYEQIIQIKDICRFVPDVEGEKEWLPVHYTKIDTLKKLLSGDNSASGKLRLWNTVYMNDTFEGESFIEMMKHAAKKMMQDDRTGDKEGDIDRRVIEKMKKYFPYLDKTASAEEALVPINENIYVTSFSREENGIYMWIPYGDGAKGCTITFEEDFFDIRKTRDVLTDVAAYSDEDYPLYEIQYLSEGDLSESSRKENKIANILHIMGKIWKILDDLENRLEEKGVLGAMQKKKENKKAEVQNEKKKKEEALVRGFIADCLNEVRFLIKSSEYSFEKEVRMLHYSYEPELETENHDIPRLYVNVDRDIRIKEVKLGPKISEFETNEIVSWLSKTGRVGCITKSGRHYQ